MLATLVPGLDPKGDSWANQIIARPKVQDWVSRMPLLRGFAKRDGAQLFDLVQGFVKSQVLMALVQLEMPQRLLKKPTRVGELAGQTGLDPDRLELLLKAGVGIGILRHRLGRYGLTRQGAALVGVPGLQEMILHHTALYRDMQDPVALLRGEAQTELAAFWPYVFGAAGAQDPEVAKRYSDLMADTQGMVARDTLQMVDFSGARRVMDVGGGSGAFAIAVAQDQPQARLDLVDLPAVAPDALARIAASGLQDRITFHGLSFRDDPLPTGADTICLIRVLYDHSDETVRALLAKVYDALPEGGRLVVSEPMSGGTAPDPITDVYFAFYTLAMRTGRTRSAAEITRLCQEAGFAQIETYAPRRSYVTAALRAVKGVAAT